MSHGPIGLILWCSQAFLCIDKEEKDAAAIQSAIYMLHVTTVTTGIKAKRVQCSGEHLHHGRRCCRNLVSCDNKNKLSVDTEKQQQPWFQEIKPPQCEATEHKLSETECVCPFQWCVPEKETIKCNVGGHTSFLAAPTWPPDSAFYFYFDKEVCESRSVLNTCPRCVCSLQLLSENMLMVLSISSHTINKQQAVSQHWLP